MNKCVRCGFESEGRFCPMCGMEFGQKMHICKGCGRNFAGNFCPECGTRYEFTHTCKNCGAEVSSKYCPECGTLYEDEIPVVDDSDLFDITLGSCDKTYEGSMVFAPKGNGYIVKGIGECVNTDIVVPSEYDGKTVTGIADSAFKECKSLTSVVIPDTVTDVGYYVFKGCSALDHVIIGNGVKSIKSGAFHGCIHLNSVTIGNGVTSVGNYAFEECKSLERVYYRGNKDGWKKLSVGANNEFLAKATVYYYSATPTSIFDGNFWHYDEKGNPTVW